HTAVVWKLVSLEPGARSLRLLAAKHRLRFAMAEWMDLEISFWFIVAIGLGLVLLVGRKTQTPSSVASPRSSGATASSKRKQGMGAGTPASKAAKDAAKHLGLGTGARGRRVPVTVCVPDAVLTKDERDEWSVNESALRALALLNEVASVFLVCWVESDEEERRVKEVALSRGLTSSGLTTSTSAASASSSSPASLAGAFPTGIPEHRLLFCSSHIGQVAIVRQLTPSLHIGGPIALLEGIYRFVPSLVRIDPSAVEPPPDATPPPEPTTGQGARKATGGGGLEWREFRSLAAALGLPLYAPDSLRSPRGVGGG
ncbi:unnamed protein product, partial [Laminaria digitata]